MARDCTDGSLPNPAFNIAGTLHSGCHGSDRLMILTETEEERKKRIYFLFSPTFLIAENAG